MATVDRHEYIVNALQRDGQVDVADLAESLGTAQLTIRRDLTQLETAGVLRRVRGGAINLMMRGEGLPFAVRSIDHADSKDRMAAAAAELIRDGEAVVIDSGTTGAAAARALARRRITAMPLSLQTIAALSDSSTVDLILPGGQARPHEGSIVGPMAESNLRALRFDVAILTCCGVSSADGVTAHDLQDAAVKSTALAVSRRTILLAEGAKFARTAMATVCAVTDLDVVITDESIPPAELDQLRAAGVEVIQI